MNDNSTNDLTPSNSIEIQKWAHDFESTNPPKDFPKSVKKNLKQEQSPTNNFCFSFPFSPPLSMLSVLLQWIPPPLSGPSTM